jgi:O-antigen ligase
MVDKKEEVVPFSEKVFAVCALLYASTAFIRVLMNADEYAATGDEALASPVKRILWTITYVMAGYFFSKRYRPALAVLRKMPLLVLLMTYIAASVLWSESRTISILSVAALAGNSLIGVYFGVRYGIAEFLRLLGWFCGITAVATFLSPLLIRYYYVDGGYWTGFFANKNALGMNMTVGFLVFVMLARNEKKWKWLHGAFSALCAGLIFLSGSTTCIVIFFVLICAMVFQVFLEEYLLSSRSRALFAVLFSGCTTAIVLLYWEGILSALEKSETLLGRVVIWIAMISMARGKALLGYGYGGFWVFGGPAQTIWDTLRIDPSDASYAHNGYLQLLLDCGIIGLALLFGLLFIASRKVWSYFRKTNNGWPLYFLLFLLLHNLAESTFVARNNISWLLFVAVLVQLTRVLSAKTRKAAQVEAVYRPRSEISSAPA